MRPVSGRVNSKKAGSRAVHLLHAPGNHRPLSDDAVVGIAHNGHLTNPPLPEVVVVRALSYTTPRDMIRPFPTEWQTPDTFVFALHAATAWPPDTHRLRPRSATSASRVRREKAVLSSGCKPHPTTAPAESNRSSHVLKAFLRQLTSAAADQGWSRVRVAFETFRPIRVHGIEDYAEPTLRSSVPAHMVHRDCRLRGGECRGSGPMV